MKVTDIIKDCELYAKVIEGIIVVEDDWQPGDPERHEPRETLLKAAAEIKRLRSAIGDLHRVWFTGVDVDKDAVTAACLHLFVTAHSSTERGTTE